jgi:hypothetical protein
VQLGAQAIACGDADIVIPADGEHERSAACDQWPADGLRMGDGLVDA